MGNFSEKHAAEQAALLAQGVQNLRLADNNRANITFFSQFLGPETKGTSGPSTPTLPAFFCITDAFNMYLVLDGITTWEQGFNIAEGYRGGLLTSTIEPYNAYYENATTAILSQIKGAGINWPPQIWCGGWSLGGVVGSMMPAYSKLDPPAWMTSTVHSYGSPRPGGRQLAHRINGSTKLYRWMNDNDPVPMVPPRVRDFPIVAAMFGVHGALRAQNFVHPPGGFSLWPNGTGVAQELPRTAQASFTMSLAQWLFDWDNNNPADHHITEYVRRLGLRAIVTKPVGQQVLAPIERVDRQGAQQVRLQADRFAGAVRDLEVRQNSVPVVIPGPVLFFAVRSEGTWSVQFSDQIVAACGSKRAALRLARRGNDFLRDLQRRAAVDPAAVSLSLETFLTLASDPTSPFRPTMNTQFPN